MKMILISLHNKKDGTYGNPVIAYDAKQIKRDMEHVANIEGSFPLDTIENGVFVQVGIFELDKGITDTEIKKLFTVKSITPKGFIKSLKKEAKNAGKTN